MKILAEQGNRYLLVEDGVDELEYETAGRILDMDQGKLFPWMRALTALNNGGWTEYGGSQAVVGGLVDSVEEVSREESGLPRQEDVAYPAGAE